MVTVQFSASPLYGSYIIRAFTWSDFSHIDVVLPNGKLFGALAKTGVCEHDFGVYSAVKRFQVEVADEAKLFEILKSQEGKPYDWAGVIGLGLHRNWEDDDKWFCSELMAWAFKQAGTPLLNADDAFRITPRDLLLSPLLKPM